MRGGWEGHYEDSRRKPTAKARQAHTTLFTIFVERALSQSFSTVVEKLLTKLLRQLVGLTLFWSTFIDVVLHVTKRKVLMMFVI